MGEKAGEQCISLTSCHISSDVRWRVTPHIEWIFIKLADRGALGGTGGFQIHCKATEQKTTLKTSAQNEISIQVLFKSDTWLLLKHLEEEMLFQLRFWNVYT